MAGRGRCPLLRAARVRAQGTREGRADGELAVPQGLGAAHKTHVDAICWARRLPLLADEEPFQQHRPKQAGIVPNLRTIADRDAALGAGKRAGVHAAGEVGCSAPCLTAGSAADVVFETRSARGLHRSAACPCVWGASWACPRAVVGSVGAPVVSVLQQKTLREAVAACAWRSGSPSGLCIFGSPLAQREHLSCTSSHTTPKQACGRVQAAPLPSYTPTMPAGDRNVVSESSISKSAGTACVPLAPPPGLPHHLHAFTGNREASNNTPRRTHPCNLNHD